MSLSQVDFKYLGLAVTIDNLILFGGRIHQQVTCTGVDNSCSGRLRRRMVVTFPSLAMILGEDSTIHSRALFFFFFKVKISLLTPIPLFTPGPELWLSELRRLWPGVALVRSYSDK